MKNWVLMISLVLLLACAPQSKNDGPHISVQALSTIVTSGGYVLDVRSAEEFAQGHINGAVSIPFEQLSKRLQEIPEGKPVYVVCRKGEVSAQAVELLQKAGYQEVSSLTDGMNGWEAADMPLVKSAGDTVR